MWWKSISVIFKAGQSIHELHVCSCYLMLLSRTVYSLTREIYLAGRELNIQTLTFLVLTSKQYVNAKITWGSEVRNTNRKTIIASLPWLTRPGEAGFFRTESAFYLWSAVFSLHFIPGLQSAIAILWEEQKFQRKNIYLYQEILFQKWRNLSFIFKKMHDPQTPDRKMPSLCVAVLINLTVFMCQLWLV